MKDIILLLVGLGALVLLGLFLVEFVRNASYDKGRLLVTTECSVYRMWVTRDWMWFPQHGFYGYVHLLALPLPDPEDVLWMCSGCGGRAGECTTCSGTGRDPYSYVCCDGITRR